MVAGTSAVDVESSTQDELSQVLKQCLPKLKSNVFLKKGLLQKVGRVLNDF